MAIIDDRTRELSCKVLFVGPPAAGVGTTFRELWTLIPDAAESAVIPKPGDPPIYELRYRPRPAVRKQGLTLVLHLVGYEDSPRSEEFGGLLQGADGIVLVMDSAPTAMSANQRALQDADSSLGIQGRSFEQLAVLLQYNKRDLADALSIRQLEERLNAHRWPYVATSAHRAQGLQDMLERLTALMSKWVRVPAQSVQAAAPPARPPATPRPAGGRLQANPTPTRGGKPQAPTSSMVDAFARAEQKIFGRQQPAPGLGDEVDEDSTVLAGSGGPPPSAPALSSSGRGAEQWEDDPTQVTGQPSSAPRMSGAGSGGVSGPLGRPLHTDWSEDGPTQLDSSHRAAAALGVDPAQAAAGGVPWESASPSPPSPPVPQPMAPAAPNTPEPQPLSAQPAAPEPSEDHSVAPWEEPSTSAPAPEPPPAEASAPQPAPAARPAEGTRVVHVPVPELTGHTIETVGVAALKDMVTVTVPLTTSVGRDERSVELRFEMGGAALPTKAPDAPAQGGGKKVALPLYVLSVGFFALAAAALLVLYILK